MKREFALVIYSCSKEKALTSVQKKAETSEECKASKGPCGQ